MLLPSSSFIGLEFLHTLTNYLVNVKKNVKRRKIKWVNSGGEGTGTVEVCRRGPDGEGGRPRVGLWCEREVWRRGEKVACSHRFAAVGGRQWKLPLVSAERVNGGSRRGVACVWRLGSRGSGAMPARGQRSVGCAGGRSDGGGK